LQPLDLEDASFINSLEELNIDLIVIVAFRKLPRIVWEMPKKGTFNLHGSLLPRYRGAAPLNWAVINGDVITGVTTFFLEEKIDTGKIISQSELNIGENDSVGDVHDKLMYIGAELVFETVKNIQDGSAKAIEQDVKDVPDYQKKAPKIFKSTGLIDWRLSVQKIHNLVRGLSPYPGAHTILENDSKKRLKIKIFKTEIVNEKQSNDESENGGIVTDSKTELKVNCPGGQLKILELQLEGKKRMTTQQFLQGNKLLGCQFV
jgi:methionyl-tRNA formyltransferase